VKGRKAVLIALAIALLGSLGRFPVPSTPFWFDEAYTANMATFPKGLWAYVENAKQEPHPPLYYLYARLVAEAAGKMDSPGRDSPPPGVEAALRAGNTPIAFLTLYLVSLAHPVAGLALLASPSWLAKVDEARMYPLMGLLLASALYALWARRFLLAGALTLLALYTHYLSLLFVPFFLLAALLASREERSSLPLLSFALPLLLFVPWLPLLLLAIRGGANSYLRPDPLSSAAAAGELGGYPLGLALMAIPLLAAFRLRQDPPRAFLLAVPYLAVIAWWLTGYLYNTAGPRYWGAFLPAQALALGLALREGRIWRGVHAAVLAASLPGLLWAFTMPEELRVMDEGFRDFSTLLSRLEERQGHVVVLGNEGGRLMALRYYHRSQGTEFLLPDGGYGERPWEGRWAGFVIFPPNVGLETRGVPELYGLLLALHMGGCEAKVLSGYPLLYALVRCGKTPVPDWRVRRFMDGIDYMEKEEKGRVRPVQDLPQAE